VGANDRQSRDDRDPEFDGHLQKPLEQMTVDERLDWIWQMMLFREWAAAEGRRVGRADDAIKPK
jgi:hypothetical protein